MYLSMGVVHVGASERSCYFLSVAVELQQFCEIFAESALFLIFYLVSICINERTKQEE